MSSPMNLDDWFTRHISRCMRCVHYRQGNLRQCAAFPAGPIPEEIWKEEFDHSKPYPGDHGLRFRLMTSEERHEYREELRLSRLRILSKLEQRGAPVPEAFRAELDAAREAGEVE
jgi:hypothetical protein